MSVSLTDITVTRRTRLKELKAREKAFFDLNFLRALPPEHRSEAIDLLDRSQSQLRQDLFALVTSGFKQDGYFVEFGATDGKTLSNTWMLEKDYGWTGILAEPARSWHDDLRANRSAIIDSRCVWKSSGDNLEFTEAPRGENSGISSFVSQSRKVRGTSYEVETLSLNDLLHDHDAPEKIDYISIDTEGSEFDILDAFDFSRWSFGLMTVEHNFEPQRAKVHNLLTSVGYRRVLEEVSRFDDWYVRAG